MLTDVTAQHDSCFSSEMSAPCCIQSVVKCLLVKVTIYTQINIFCSFQISLYESFPMEKLHARLHDLKLGRAIFSTTLVTSAASSVLVSTFVVKGITNVFALTQTDCTQPSQ